MANEERRPLLGEADDRSLPEVPKPALADATLPRILRIGIPGLLIIVLFVFGATISGTAINELAEGAICQRIHRTTDPRNDPRCKDDAVQAELAFINGIDSSIGLIPGLLTCIPYGLMADKVGPMRVLLLLYLGDFLMVVYTTMICLYPYVFNPRMLWFGSAFNLIGGGPVVWESMKLTVAGALATEKQRTTVFLYAYAARAASGLLSGPIVYACMKVGPVFAQGCSLVGLLFATLLTLTLPKIEPAKKQSLEAEEEESRKQFSFRQTVSEVKEQARLILHNLFVNNVVVGFLLISLIFTTLGAYEVLIRAQYARKRFDWTWGETGFLASITAAVSLGLTTMVLPSVSWVLSEKAKLSSMRKDLWLSRVSIVVMVIGSFATGLAPTVELFLVGMVICDLGMGFPPALFSVMASLVGSEHHGLLYTCISLVRSLGQLTAGPLLSWAFQLGIKWGKEWYGIPFILAGLLQIVAVVIVFSVRSKRQPE